METKTTRIARQSLQSYAVRRISRDELIAILVAAPINAVNDPAGTGTAYSAQLAVAQFDQGSSVTQILEGLGVS